MSVDVSELSAHLPEAQRKAVRADYKHAAKSATTAFILCFFLGIFGAHRFYLGQTRQGLIRLVLSPLIVPGLIWEVIDLFRIDQEVEHDNLLLAEHLIARAALAVPLSAAAIAAAPHVTMPASPQPAPTMAEQLAEPLAEPAFPDPPVAARAPASALAGMPEAERAPAWAPDPVATEAPPPIWPVEPDLELPAWATEGIPAEESTVASALPAAPEPAPGIVPDLAPAWDAPTAPAGPSTAAPSATFAMHDATTDAGAASAPAPAPQPQTETPPHTPEPAMPPETHPEAAPWLAAAGAAVATPLAFEALTTLAAHATQHATPGTDERQALEPAAAADASTTPAPPPATPASVSRPLDYTDRSVFADPVPLAADVGEDTGGRLRVVLPGYSLAREAEHIPPAEPTGEPAAPTPAEPASLVFVADPAYAAPTLPAAEVAPAPVEQVAPTEPEPATSAAPEPRPETSGLGALAVGGAALGGVLAAGAAAAFSVPEPAAPASSSPDFDQESPTEPMPVIRVAHEGGAEGESQTRVVKRVRVVRRLVVDGKVVHEAVAEQVVDPDADTAATATSLQEALRSGDGPRIAALTKPLRPAESAAETDAAQASTSLAGPDSPDAQPPGAGER